MATSKGVIKNINTDQHRIFADIMTLYNDGKGFELDPTYSKGNFYGTYKWTNADGILEEYEIPQPKYKMDVYPLFDDVQKLEIMGKFPLEDGSVSSCNIDLPFIISTGPSMGNGNKKSNMTSNRFSAFYPVSELVKTYYHFLKEAYRVLKQDGILVWKCQRTITGSKTLNSPEMSWLFAESLGFDCIDSFYLEAKNRLISGKVKNQQHSRSYVSVFYVFKKSQKKKINYLDSFSEFQKNNILEGIKKNNIKDTKKTSQYNNHSYVDLGLPSGTLWATCNIGATSPEQVGKYFQWGDTVGYTAEELGIGSDNKILTGSKQYNWADYKFSVNGRGRDFTKYSAADGKMNLDPEDDAATVNMGRSWRMPTKAEFQELIDNTVRKLTTLNGVNGTLFISTANSNTLFLPSSGFLSGGYRYNGAPYNSCWSVSHRSDYIYNAWYFKSYLYGETTDYSIDRCVGMAVRGVFKKRTMKNGN